MAADNQKITMDINAAWSVTLTGKTVNGKEAAAIWEQVAQLMRIEPAAFQERIRNRLPFTLKPVGQTEACAQRDALIEAGAEAVALADRDDRQLWLRTDQGLCGPVSEAYARHAVEHGALDRQLNVCIKGENIWQTLEVALGLPSAPKPPPKHDVAKSLDTSAAAPPPRQRATSERFDTSASAEPLQRRPPSELPLDGYEIKIYGGFWLRFVARIIDGLAMRAGLYVLEHIFSGSLLIQGLIELAFLLLYFPLWESSATQATPGKMAIGLQVTDAYGNRIGFWQAFARNFGVIISYLTFFIGFIMAGMTARKQALHDLIAGTFVVRKHELQAWQLVQVQLDRDDPKAYRKGMSGWGIAVLVAVGAFVVTPVVAAVSYGGYQRYVTRDQLSEAIELADSAKQAVAAQLKWTRMPPTDNAVVGIGAPETFAGKYVSSVAIKDGVVEVTFGNQAAPILRDKHLLFIPSRENSDVTWTCGSSDIAKFIYTTACLP